MSESVRLFVGIDVSLECVNQLRNAASSLREQMAACGATWIPPERYHVTLKYLGWAAAESVYAVRDALAPVLEATQELRLEVGGLGAFPTPEAARVLWAGVDGGKALTALAGSIDDAAQSLGFARESRGFQPHVTLARFREVADISSFVVGSEHQYSSSRVRFVKLFESGTSSEASGYRSHLQWRLKSTKRHRSDLEQRDT